VTATPLTPSRRADPLFSRFGTFFPNSLVPLFNPLVAGVKLYELSGFLRRVATPPIARPVAAVPALLPAGFSFPLVADDLSVTAAPFLSGIAPYLLDVF